MRTAKKDILLLISLVGVYSCSGNVDYSSNTGISSSTDTSVSFTSNDSDDDSNNVYSSDQNAKDGIPANGGFTYTITWKNQDGTILKIDECQAYVTPLYSGPTPQKAGEGDLVFVFSGWTPALVPAVSDQTYTALFASYGIDDLYDFQYSSEYDGYMLTGKSSMQSLNTTALSLPSHYDGEEGEKPVVGLSGSAFANFNKIKEIDLPEELKYIGEKAFSDCFSLTDMDLPDDVETIGPYAFGYCSKLQTIALSESLRVIDTSAFFHCSSLKSIAIPDDTETIGDFAFAYCSSLYSVSIGSSLTTIGNNAFIYDTSLTYFLIPASVTTMGEKVFAYCYNLFNIYCEAASQPSGWDKQWRSFCGAKINWGYNANE